MTKGRTAFWSGPSFCGGKASGIACEPEWKKSRDALWASRQMHFRNAQSSHRPAVMMAME